MNLRRLMLNMLPLPRASERIQIFLTLAEKCKWKIETLMMDLVMDQTGLDLTVLGVVDNGHVGTLFFEKFKREKLEELKRIWSRKGRCGGGAGRGDVDPGLQRKGGRDMERLHKK